MIGNLLKREYERGVSECASNAGGKKSKRDSMQFEQNDQDLTQSLLSANSTKEPQYSLLELPQDQEPGFKQAAKKSRTRPITESNT